MIVNIAELLPPPLLRQDVAAWRQIGYRVAGCTRLRRLL
jgi:hypothetical protein